MPNKVTEVIYCHCEAAASIMRATVFSVVSYTHASHLDISAVDRAAGAHIDESIDTSSAEPRMAARDKCDAISLPDIRHTSQQLSASAVAPAMWKSSQSLQQVMPWPLAGRRRHLHR